jgi:MFS family permease
MAMREAGRALGLDPGNAKAQFVLGRLLLDAPAQIPAEALASADHERGETRQKAVLFAGRGFLAFVPVICVFFALPVRHVWPIVVMLVLAAITGGVCLVLARRVLPMKTPWLLVVVALTTVMLSILGIMFSPLLIMPIFLIGSLAGILQQPTSWSPWIVVVAHAIPLVGLLALEYLGVIPSTFHVGDGGLTFTLWVIDMTPEIAMVLFGLAFVTQSIHITGVTLIGKRAAEAAQNRQHAVAWHLRQMLPEADDTLDITGKVPKG